MWEFATRNPGTFAFVLFMVLVCLHDVLAGICNAAVKIQTLRHPGTVQRKDPSPDTRTAAD